MKKSIGFSIVVLIALLIISCTQTSNLNKPTTPPVDPGGVIEFGLLDFEGLDYANDVVLVKYRNLDGLQSSLQARGSRVLQQWDEISWVSVSVPGGVDIGTYIRELMKNPAVLIAQPNFKLELPTTKVVDDSKVLTEPQALPRTAVLGPDVELHKLWGMTNIRATEAWEDNTGSENVILAIIDTGVDVSHPEFAAHAIVGAFDATGEGRPLIDLHGHGTHVAGTAGADGRYGKIAGVVWDSPIMPVRAMDKEGLIYTTYLIDGTLHVADFVQNAPGTRAVINMSIGGRGYNYAFKDAIDYAIDNGVVFVTSAGNSYKRIPSYPTSYNGVIAVAATTPKDGKADFSTTGPWTSVGAPGVAIYSSVPGNGYDYWQGTSMASPHVAGAAAMLLAKYPNLTPIQVKNQLEATARGTGFNEELGYGIIDTVAMQGPLAPQKYGSLVVSTNLIQSDLYDIGIGIIVVFDANDHIASYGTTGEDGKHIFHNLLEGQYKVQVAYYNPIDATFTTQVKTVNLAKETTEHLDFFFGEERVKATVHISVLEWMSGPALVGADVQVRDSEGNMIVEGITDASGFFSFAMDWEEEEGDRIEEVEILVTRQGFAPSKMEGLTLFGSTSPAGYENMITMAANRATLNPADEGYPGATVVFRDMDGNPIDLNNFPAGPFKLDATFSDYMGVVYAAVGYVPWAQARDAHSFDQQEAVMTLNAAGRSGIVPINLVLYNYNRARTHLVFYANVVNNSEPVLSRPAPTDLWLYARTTDRPLEFYSDPRNEQIIQPDDHAFLPEGLLIRNLEERGAPEGCNVFVQVAWTGVEGAVGYNVYHSLVSGTQGFHKVGFRAQTFVFHNGHGLEPGVPSWFKVRAVFADGSESADSNVVMLVPLDIFKVDLVTPADGASDVSQLPTFTWKPVGPDGTGEAQVGMGILPEENIIYAYLPWIYDTNHQRGQHIVPYVNFDWDDPDESLDDWGWQFETWGPKEISVDFLAEIFYDEVDEETYPIDWLYFTPEGIFSYPYESLEAYKTYEWGMDFAFAYTAYQAGGNVFLFSITTDYGFGWAPWTNPPDTLNRFTTGNDVLLQGGER